MSLSHGTVMGVTCTCVDYKHGVSPEHKPDAWFVFSPIAVDPTTQQPTFFRLLGYTYQSPNHQYVICMETQKNPLPLQTVTWYITLGLALTIKTGAEGRVSLFNIFTPSMSGTWLSIEFRADTAVSVMRWETDGSSLTSCCGEGHLVKPRHRWWSW